MSPSNPASSLGAISLEAGCYLLVVKEHCVLRALPCDLRITGGLARARQKNFAGTPSLLCREPTEELSHRSVNLLKFSQALAQAGIGGRHDVDRSILVIEPAPEAGGSMVHEDT